MKVDENVLSWKSV